MQTEEKLERFVLLLKSVELTLNELSIMASECLDDKSQKNLRRRIAELWVCGMDIRSGIRKSASNSFKERINNLYPEDRD